MYYYVKIEKNEICMYYTSADHKCLLITDIKLLQILAFVGK